MIIAILGKDGTILSMREADTPLEGLPSVFDASTGELVKQTRRILKGCEGKSVDYILQHMKPKHDNGDGSVEMESDGKDT